MRKSYFYLHHQSNQTETSPPQHANNKYRYVFIVRKNFSIDIEISFNYKYKIQ